MDEALDRLLPRWDERSAHTIEVAARAAATDAAVRALDMSASLPCRLLFRLRGMSRRTLRFEELAGAGFVRLVDRPGLIVHGLIGRFWRPSGHLQRFAPEEFTALCPPGYAKAAWAIRVEPNARGSRVLTETRIHACDEAARRSLRRYWRLIAPFSGLIRREALRLVREAAET